MALKVGIIGAGRFGLNYWKTFEELKIPVKAICAPRKETLDAAVRGHKNKPARTTDYHTILNDPDIDAVAITSPGSTHYDIAMDALGAGKHVICEKPIAFHAGDVQDLINTARQRGRVLLVGHLHRYNSAIEHLKTDIGKGTLGKIHLMHSIGTGGPVRTDMSALWDYMPHDITILSYLLDEFPKQISVRGKAILTPDVHDEFNADIYFTSTMASAFGSWYHPQKKRELVVVGEKGYAVFDDYADKQLAYYEIDISKEKHSIIINPSRAIYPKVNSLKPLTTQIRHFMACIRNGEKPITGGEHALAVTHVLEAGEKSLKSNGELVTVGESKKN